MTINQALNEAVGLYKAGNIEVAKRLFSRIIQIEPNQPDANHNMGRLLFESGNLKEALPYFKTALEANFGVTQYWFSYIDVLFRLQRFSEASELFALAKNKGCKGLEFDDLGEKINASIVEFETEIPKLQGVIEDGPYAYLSHFRIGATFQKLGKLEKAIEAYNKALSLKPDYAEAYYNMGTSLAGQGKLAEAIEAYSKALSFKPDFFEAFSNMGLALNEQGKLEEAVEACNKALSLKPDYAEAYNNMGITLADQGKLEEAIEAYNKAISLEPGFTEAHSNMGLALTDQGKLEEAIEAYHKALTIKPDYAVAWNNIVFPLVAIKYKISSEEELVSYYPKDTGSNYYQIAIANLNYSLSQGGTNAKASLNTALDMLSKAENITIQNPEPGTGTGATGSQTQLTDKVFALKHFGRSGTGLLHSLIDGHPEVSTLPSIYLSQYFDHSTWEKIISRGWYNMAECFIQIYDVLFDANSIVPIETKSNQMLRSIGFTEGMTTVGDDRNEVLSLDKELFRAELQHRMNCYDQLNPTIFFKLVHVAFEKTLNKNDHKNIIFYHIHNPDTYAELNFIQSVPKANWLMMVREPVQSCESWLRSSFEKNDYFSLAQRIRTMLFEIDNIIYHQQNSVGVRLEDLKEHPRQTISALCEWMGISEENTLYEMTAQGKKWWGDPSSPDFTTDGMDPFGTTSISRKVGSIFSEGDQFILRTLFYPFRVRFDYIKENKEQFKIDLQTTRPMLDKMFSFEKVIVKNTNANPKEFVKSGSYLRLRSALIERWNTLNKFGTYSNMLTPLEI